jgi:putative transposase
VAIEVPRDRERSYEPQLIARHERRFTAFDDKVIALHAQAYVWEIQGFRKETYVMDVSPT